MALLAEKYEENYSYKFVNPFETNRCGHDFLIIKRSLVLDIDEKVNTVDEYLKDFADEKSKEDLNNKDAVLGAPFGSRAWFPLWGHEMNNKKRRQKKLCYGPQGDVKRLEIICDKGAAFDSPDVPGNKILSLSCCLYPSDSLPGVCNPGCRGQDTAQTVNREPETDGKEKDEPFIATNNDNEKYDKNEVKHLGSELCSRKTEDKSDLKHLGSELCSRKTEDKSDLKHVGSEHCSRKSDEKDDLKNLGNELCSRKADVRLSWLRGEKEVSETHSFVIDDHEDFKIINVDDVDTDKRDDSEWIDVDNDETFVPAFVTTALHRTVESIGQKEESKLKFTTIDWNGNERRMSTVITNRCREIKGEISRRIRVPKDQFWMMIDGRGIDESRTVKENRIKEGSIVKLFLKLKGGTSDDERVSGDDDDERNGAQEDEKLRDLRLRWFEKGRKKNRVTRLFNGIVNDLKAADAPTRKEQYDGQYEELIEEINNLSELAKKLKQKEKVKEMKKEIEQLEARHERINNMFERMAEVSLRQEELSVSGSETKHEKRVEHNSWNKLDKLKKIEIPIFSGDVREYEKWQATFKACVDDANGTKEAKLLHLRQYLKGEPLRLVERLGFTAKDYDDAKLRLDERYGGTDREYRNVIEQIDKFRPMRLGELKDLEMLEELTDNLILVLRKMGKEYELDNGFIYQRLIKKLPESMILDWTRWQRQNAEERNVPNLLEWIKEELHDMREAHEEVRENNTYVPRVLGRREGQDNVKFGRRTHVAVDNRRTKKVEFTNEIRSSEPSNNNISKPNLLNTNQTYSREDQYSQRQCLLCKGSHFLDQCTKFRDKDLQERKRFVEESRLCYNCLKKGHMVKNCQKKRMCWIAGCLSKHSVWLHEPKKDSKVMETNETTLQKEATTMMTNKGIKENNNGHWISLRTVPVILRNGNRSIEVNALLDDASTTSYINQSVMDELRLTGTAIEMPVSVIGGRTEYVSAYGVKMQLLDKEEKLETEFKAFALGTVVGTLKVIDWAEVGQKWSHLKNVNFPKLKERFNVDVLIGADYLDLHQATKEIKGQEGEPIARLTPLGWTCVGGPHIGNVYKHQTNFIRTFVTKNDDLHEMVKRFWELEESEIRQQYSKDDEVMLNRTRETMKNVNGRFQVAIPWKIAEPWLPENRKMAEGRFQNLERKFARVCNLKKDYEKIIYDYIMKGYITRVLEADQRSTKWLLPHFPVIKSDRQTTKIRIVFDAAAKMGGICLNDLIETGPKLQNDLFKILIRFRRGKIAIVSDISEMYLQIEIEQRDRPYLRFLMKEHEKYVTYEFNRLVFGLNTSPFLAQLVSQENARENQEEFPRAAETIIHSTYMDDSLDSVETEEEAVQLRKDLIIVWEKAGMQAKKWMSNSSKVLQEIPIEDRASSLTLNDEGKMTMKTLGLMWTTDEDMFRFQIKKFEEENITKRNLLSWIAKMFDPLGMLSCYIIRGKMLIQKIWVLGVEWDDPLPHELARDIRKWVNEVTELEQVRVKRNIISSKTNYKEIHVFSDASSEAYGAVAYLRETTSEGVRIRMIASKAKVAPVKIVSIPRLELLGAVVAVNLARKISSVLDFNLRDVIFWTDSKDVLYWIKNYARKFKQFVANRVGNIQDQTDGKQWRYVPTKENPADLLSRGMSAKRCVEEEMWWQGPSYLKNEESFWPETVLPISFERVNEEKKTTLVTHEVEGIQKLTQCVSCLEPRTYSNWTRLKRVLSWLLRFVNNCRLRKENRWSGELSVKELVEAELRLIREDQKTQFLKDYEGLKRGQKVSKDSRLSKLNPKIDEMGLLRSDSRVINAQFLSYDEKFPIIIEGKGWIARLIVGDYHIRNRHYAGVNHMLRDLNERFWILKAKRLIVAVAKECLVCKRRRGKTMEQIMAPLPAFRFEEPLAAFARTAVDFGGPFETRQGRGRSKQKRYLCLFVCLQTRAVHLEMAYGLDTDSFLKALLRFVARRGRPKLILSDNGTNFVGATKELNNVVIDGYRMEKELSKKDIRWVFNPPAGSHFGGVFESMIKSAKKAMKAILENADLTDEELQTVIAQSEDLLNSRPLMIVETDEKSSLPLTPNMFLRGVGTTNSDGDLELGSRVRMSSRWRVTMEIRKQIWQRWMKEIVPTWRGRQKWRTRSQTIKVGDLCWICDKSNAVGRWPMAKVLKVFAGPDGEVRVVSLKSEGKTVLRPVVKLVPLELNEQDDEGLLTISRLTPSRSQEGENVKL